MESQYRSAKTGACWVNGECEKRGLRRRPGGWIAHSPPGVTGRGARYKIRRRIPGVIQCWTGSRARLNITSLDPDLRAIDRIRTRWEIICSYSSSSSQYFPSLSTVSARIGERKKGIFFFFFWILVFAPKRDYYDYFFFSVCFLSFWLWEMKLFPFVTSLIFFFFSLSLLERRGIVRRGMMFNLLKERQGILVSFPFSFLVL